MSKKISRLFSGMLIISMLMLLFVFPTKSSESIMFSCTRCVTSLLPSLFPMMVLSRQLAGYINLKDNRFSRILSRLSGFSENLLPVFFISLLCGYPIPAIIAKDMYDSGRINKKQAVVAINLCNSASPAFLIFFVGRFVLGSMTKGILLFLCQSLAVIVIAHKTSTKERSVQAFSVEKEKISDSVSKSTQNLVGLFGFVIFFSLAGDLLNSLFDYFQAGTILKTIVSGCFEITSGIAACKNYPNVVKTIFVCFLSCFGGLSVYFQLASVTKGTELVTPKYFIYRLFVFIFTLFFYSLTTFLLNSLYFGEAAW